jgi:hypothetical protein
LYTGFAALGLLVGLFTGLSKTPVVQGVLSSILVFVSGLIVAGGTSILIADLKTTQQQAVGVCLTSLAAFAIIGALFGIGLREWFPISAAQRTLLKEQARIVHQRNEIIAGYLRHVKRLESTQDDHEQEELLAEIRLFQQALSVSTIGVPIAQPEQETGIVETEGAKTEQQVVRGREETISMPCLVTEAPISAMEVDTSVFMNIAEDPRLTKGFEREVARLVKKDKGGQHDD